MGVLFTATRAWPDRRKRGAKLFPELASLIAAMLGWLALAGVAGSGLSSPASRKQSAKRPELEAPEALEVLVLEAGPDRVGAAMPHSTKKAHLILGLSSLWLSGVSYVGSR